MAVGSAPFVAVSLGVVLFFSTPTSSSPGNDTKPPLPPLRAWFSPVALRVSPWVVDFLSGRGAAGVGVVERLASASVAGVALVSEEEDGVASVDAPDAVPVVSSAPPRANRRSCSAFNGLLQ